MKVEKEVGGVTERKQLTLIGRPSFQCVWAVSLGIID